MAPNSRRPAGSGSSRPQGTRGQRGRAGRSPVSGQGRPGKREDRRPAGGPGSASAGGRRQSTRPTQSPSTGAGRGSGPGQGPNAGLWAAGGPFARRSTRRLAVLGAVFVVLAVMIVPTLRAYLQQRGEYAALLEQTASQEKSVADLQGQVKQWNDPAYLEQQARERLKFVRPGETVYQVIGAEKLLGDPFAGRANVISPNRGDSSVPWYGRMWTSIVIADRPPVDGVTPLTPVGAGSGSTQGTDPPDPSDGSSSGTPTGAETQDAGTSTDTDADTSP